MQNKHDEGFSLIEILVAIVILAAFVVPICGALLMSNEMNTRTDNLMQAQLAVSSAVEILMAEGISVDKLEQVGEKNWTNPQDSNDNYKYLVYEYKESRFFAVTISVVEVKEKTEGSYVAMPWYDVTVASKDGLVEVTTFVRKVS